MGNYLQAIEWGKIHKVAPDIDSVQSIGRTKYGFGINVEQSLSKNLGMFLRTGWNDGHNETWAFTEIDHHISFGFMFNGSWWNRKNDNFGIAQIVNGISKEHQDYLKSGGYGFIIGDGNLNYRPEFITELFYSFKLQHYPWWISPDFQYIIDPAYNKDRGPVLVLGIRSHVEF
jgi:high affinity Mn2+ porin